MKKITQILIGLIIIGFIYIGIQYYNDYKKKQIYKNALIRELELGYRHLEMEEIETSYQAVNKFTHEFERIKNSDYKSTDIFEKFRSVLDRGTYSVYVSNNNHTPNIIFKSAQQSGVLSQFTKRELEYLNKAYSESEKLMICKKEIRKLKQEPFFKPADDRILSWIYLKWHYILSREGGALFSTSDAYRNAILALDSNNELIKEIDSLNRIKKELLQENNND